ncbi:MAG: T9SS type A sorting domain-containing protein, partial [Candidatus Kryptoniota bacterium]
ILRRMVSMTSGYFDGEAAKEFAIAYTLPDSIPMITIRLFKLDSTTHRPVEIASVREDTIYSNLDMQALFDITAGDFDGDGLDEIMLVKNVAHVQFVNPPQATVTLDFHVYDFDPTAENFVSKSITRQTINCGSCPSGHDLDVHNLNQLVLASGDFNGDGRDECVCGWAIYWDLNNGATASQLDYEIEAFSVTPDLTTFTFAGTPYQVELANVYGGTGGGPTRSTLSLATGDLNGDGTDELVYAGNYSLVLFELSNLSSPTVLASTNCFSITDNLSHHRIAIADVDGDTTFADSASSKWYPEIITSEYTMDPRSQSTTAANNYNHIKVYKINPTNFALSLRSDLIGNFSGAVPSTPYVEAGILPAYLRGNKITMGIPKKLSVTSLVEPAVIVNAPPIHLDVIGDSCYDICKSYPIGGSSAFSSALVQSSTNQAEVTTDVHSAWGVSVGLSTKEKFLGIGVEASIKAKYGEDFKNTQRTDSTVSVKFSDLATWDDRVYATVTDYALWEYPVYADGVNKGNILAAIAHPEAARWFQSNDGNYGNDIILDHEPGNLLSYPNYVDPESNPDVGQLIYKGDLYSINPSSSPAYSELTWQTVTSNSADTTKNYGLTLGASVEGWGVKVETEGDYSRGTINTQTTTVTHSIDMKANFGAINPLYSSASYDIQPYVYWSVNGALVLDYLVELPTTGVVTSFWETNYSQKPDLTFNCYYRNFAKKGFSGYAADMADWTKEIEISPETPKPGDTVTVTAEIHNYSLLATTSQVKVHFYIGSSEIGGRTVSDLKGDSVFMTSSPVAARSDQILQFSWRVPTGLSSSDSILYAVIDPDNSIDELKEDNNKGWNRINILNVTAVHGTGNHVLSFELYQNYPNPFNPTTIIQYRLPAVSHVTLKVYDVLGREVATLVNGRETVGEHVVQFNGSRFASGVYFYRLQAGSYSRTLKLLLLK